MRHHATHAHASLVQRARDGNQSVTVRSDARAMTVDVDLDPDFERRRMRVPKVRDRLRTGDAVGDDLEVATALPQGQRLWQLRGCDADGIQHVAHTGDEKLLGLLQRGNGYALGTCRKLRIRDVDAFRGLDVRAKTDAERVHPLLHSIDVGLHPPRVDQRGRRVEIRKTGHVPRSGGCHALANVAFLRRFVCNAIKWRPRADLSRDFRMTNRLLLSEEVGAALRERRAVVALESTLIAHGMPWPRNVETALMLETEVRALGAIPATIAVVDGQLSVGLTKVEIERLGRAGPDVRKVSRRDLAVVVARRGTGATTVAATMIIANLAGIRVFATGGIGGVHRGAATTFDISADLQELARTPVAVVCAGAKSILDLGLTLEYLETHGVPVIGHGTDRLPAFYCRDSGFGVDLRLDDPEAIARVMQASWALGLDSGLV